MNEKEYYQIYRENLFNILDKWRTLPCGLKSYIEDCSDCIYLEICPLLTVDLRTKYWIIRNKLSKGDYLSALFIFLLIIILPTLIGGL